MAYEQKDNTGSLFRNDRKESEKHPDYKGQAVIGGVHYWLDGWVNEAKSGQKYLSLKLKPKDASAKPQDAPTARPAANVIDDEMPF